MGIIRAHFIVILLLRFKSVYDHESIHDQTVWYSRYMGNINRGKSQVATTAFVQYN